MEISFLGINTGGELNRGLSCRIKDIVQDIWFHLSDILHLIVSKLRKFTITDLKHSQRETCTIQLSIKFIDFHISCFRDANPPDLGSVCMHL